MYISYKTVESIVNFLGFKMVFKSVCKTKKGKEKRKDSHRLSLKEMDTKCEGATEE